MILGDEEEEEMQQSEEKERRDSSGDSEEYIIGKDEKQETIKNEKDTNNNENETDNDNEDTAGGNNDTNNDPLNNNKPKLSKQLLFLLSFAAFAVVGNLYYAQPLLVDMKEEFHKSSSQIGLVTTCTQIGYAVGLLIITPLGDIMPRKKILISLGIMVCCSLLVVGFSVSYLMLCLTSVIMGMLTVIPQIIVPLAADLADPKIQGKIIGTVMAGILLGILLSRTISGWVGEGLGWRAIYWGACIVIALTTTILHFTLPQVPATSPDTSYLQLVGSLGVLLKSQPLIWQAGIMGATVFGSFSCFWTTVTFRLSEEPYNYDSGVIGLFSLIGAAGVMGSPLGGLLVDKKGDRFTMGLALSIVFGNMVILTFLDDYLAAMIIGMFFFDMGVQTCQVCNQTRIYALVPQSKSRVNSVYMVMMFSGGAAGSALGSFSYDTWGWRGSGITALIMLETRFLSFPKKYCGGIRKPAGEKKEETETETEKEKENEMETLEAGVRESDSLASATPDN